MRVTTSTGPRRIALAATALAGRTGVLALRLSLGVVFLWFAIPKYVAGLSSQEPLAEKTINVLTLHALNGTPARLFLALLETSIGVGLLSGRLPRVTLAALVGHLAGTLTPLVLFPDQTWHAPLVPTLEGQFILKNLVFIAAAITVAGAGSRSTEKNPNGDTR
jgi:putative oxidoreductase